MPNTPVPAAGEAMPAAEAPPTIGTFSRRAMLGAIAAVPVMGAATEAFPATELTETIDDMTDEQFAALRFEAWVHTADEWKPPTNVEWANLADPHLITIRIAWLIMHKTKPELVQMIEGMDKDLFKTTFGRIDRTSEWLKGLDAIVTGAVARLACVGMSA